MSVKYLYLAAAFAVAACASTPTNGSTRSSSSLAADEIASAHADNLTAYDAVARLRPNWLAPHGVTSAQSGNNATQYAVVFVDGQEYGDINSLHNIQAYQVGNFRYYNVTEAGARWGIKAGAGGVIEVVMKGPQSQ